MKISARNQLTGSIVEIKEGAVNVEVAIEVADGVVITSIITKDSFESLGLTVGGTATAIIKANNVMVGAE
ncbi:molybdenum-pterin binding domain-containing protein [Vibrio xiamenensis]|uniref:Molybdenum-pterin binding domain-containing protein n=1 Tax=Vibrio xiamenensis TaxID=861298 RepID=A0A1G8FZQ1_9VIBR|nr:TOBE domain-containing protein [Vibrio xiamenensis]SDH87621.1 molybdenum-pterin binding domain-containing protein [Vibrio xiamenensis]